MKSTPHSGLKCIFAVLVLFVSFALRAVPGDEHWDVQFGWPGTGGNQDAIVTHNGWLYSGGAGTVLTNTPLQVWDGSQWFTLAQFYGPSTGTIIYDLKFVGDTLYVAGNFTNVSGAIIRGLAKWDGTSWSSVNNFSGTVLGLTVDGGNLYVSGSFTNPAVGGVMATNIAFWDGANWNALGNGLGNGGASSNVRACVINSGLVYVVGAFTNSGPQLATNVAVWNGTAWSAVGGGVNVIAEAITFNGSDLYVGGAFSQAGSTNISLIARWDGTNWNSVGAGLSGTQVLSLTSLNGLVYAGGLFTTTTGFRGTNVAVWNGSTWSPLGLGVSANVARVYSNTTNVLVGGNFLSAGGVIMNGIAAWDGSSWTSIGTPGRINGVSSVVHAFVGEPTNLYAGGSFTEVGQTNASLVAHFDGANWTPMGNGVGLSASTPVVNALAMDGGNNVYVGGSFTFAGNVSAINLARWDGTNWYALGNGPGGTVATITMRPDGVYASGAPQSGVNYSGPFFSRWDGTNWNSVLNYNSDDTFIQFLVTDTSIGFAAVAFQDTNIYVGGHFNIEWHDPSLTVFTNCMNIMRFDGTYARVVGTGLNSNVVAMTVLGTNLYVAGLFTNAGGVAASHIAMWDGNTWWPVGAGVVGNGTVDALTTIGTNLYAGGTFTNMGGVPASRIAKWDGAAWSALGSGASATVVGLYSAGSNVYVGGSLRAAGNMPSEFLGIWNDQLSFKTPRLSNTVWMGNGQLRTRVLSVSGTTNVVEATTDFNSWTPVMTNSIGNFDVTDAAAGNYPRRYYRARLVP